MKTLSILLLATALLAASCKKTDNQTHPHSNTSTGLVKTITYSIHGDTYTDNFTYDSQDRVSGFHSSNSLETYNYTYNSNNMLAQVDIYDSGTLKFIEKYRYAADSVLVQQYAADGVTKYIKYGFLISSNHVSKLLAWDNAETDYTRDGNNNITHWVSTQGTIVVTQDMQYDDKVSPLARIGISNLHLLYMTDLDAKDTPNNVTRRTYMSKPFVYTYLGNGLPSGADSGDGLSMTFDYLVK